MENIPQVNPGEGRDYESLKQKLLNGTVSVEAACETLFEWDQSSPSREAAEQNLAFLKAPEVVKYLTQHPEEEGPYHTLLSLTEFHVGQELAATDPTQAIEHFENALISARADKTNESWAAYVEGTLLYLKNEEIPDELIVKVEEPRNRQVLENFNAGLKVRGTPSYFEDYSK